MPLQPRLEDAHDLLPPRDGPGNWGVPRPVFRNDAEREEFVRTVGVTVYAWAFISDHIHLIFRCHEYTRHLSQKRYQSILAEEERNLLELLRHLLHTKFLASR